MGYFANDSNNIYANTKGVYILSCPISRHIKVTHITIDNYKKCFALFAARNVIKSNWINQKEEYSIPNEALSIYEEWENDSLIIGLFSNQAQQTSLRDLFIDGKRINVFNELFFISNEEMLNEIEKYKNVALYNDCKTYSKDRFLYKEINSINLSIEAKKVLECGKKLIIESVKYREEFDNAHKDVFINSWDAGWYQIKRLLEEYMSEELKDFNEKYRDLEKKMIKRVFELGFLRKG